MKELQKYNYGLMHSNPTSNINGFLQTDNHKRKALGDISNINQVQKLKKSYTFSKIEDIIEMKSNLKNKGFGNSVNQNYNQNNDNVRDIDFENSTDPQYCSEIAQIIYKKLKDREVNYKPNDKYMDYQNDINKSMFAILLDWLVEVAVEYNVNDHTIFLTKNYIERFLSSKRVARSELQLVGISAMMIASKFYEIYPPSVEDFVYISDTTYSRQQVISMEAFILNTLRFDIVPPTCTEFLKRYSIAAKIDKHQEISLFCNYLLNLTLQEYCFAKYLPSQIAISSIIVALHTFELPFWSQTLEHYSGYKLDDLEIISCTKLLYQTCSTAYSNKLEAVYSKFSQESFMCVAKKKLRSVPPLN